MFLRFSWYLLLMMGVIACCLADAAADAPMKKLMPKKRLAADPDAEYPLSDRNGPWMIMAVTFSGEGAQADAKKLVYELRKSFKLPAYTHEMTFDFTKPLQGRGLDKFGATKRMKHQRSIESREIAVLVGNYSSVDDPVAQETLQKLKYAQPDCLQLEEGKRVSRPLAAFRMVVQNQLLSSTSEKRHRGPMGHAFITTNPLLPDDYYVPKGVDKLVLKMNEEVEHCLLDCPGKYTVQVAMFTGSVIQTQAKLDNEDLENMPSRLEQAARDAHRLTAALRAKGYEAYEFHDRYSSLVTVGSFESVGTERADGKTEIDPQVHKIMKTFGAVQTQTPTGPQMGTAKSLIGIPFDLVPAPVVVPRKSISSDYEQVSE